MQGSAPGGRSGSRSERVYLAAVQSVESIGNLHEPLLMSDGDHRKLALQLAQRFQHRRLRFGIEVARSFVEDQ